MDNLVSQHRFRVSCILIRNKFTRNFGYKNALYKKVQITNFITRWDNIYLTMST